MVMWLNAEGSHFPCEDCLEDSLTLVGREGVHRAGLPSLRPHLLPLQRYESFRKEPPQQAIQQIILFPNYCSSYPTASQRQYLLHSQGASVKGNSVTKTVQLPKWAGISAKLVIYFFPRTRRIDCYKLLQHPVSMYDKTCES